MIRPAREAEIDQVARLWREMYAYQHAHGMLLPLRDDAIDIWKRQLTGRLDSPVSVILVAERADGNGLSGFLAAQVKRLPAHLTVDNGKVGFVSEVFVSPDDRQHGLGRSLVDAAFVWFAAAGVGSVELQVVANNTVARQFWERLGFTTELVQMRKLRS